MSITLSRNLTPILIALANFGQSTNFLSLVSVLANAQTLIEPRLHDSFG